MRVRVWVRYLGSSGGFLIGGKEVIWKRAIFGASFRLRLSTKSSTSYEGLGTSYEGPRSVRELRFSVEISKLGTRPRKPWTMA